VLAGINNLQILQHTTTFNLARDRCFPSSVGFSLFASTTGVIRHLRLMWRAARVRIRSR